MTQPEQLQPAERRLVTEATADSRFAEALADPESQTRQQFETVGNATYVVAPAGVADGQVPTWDAATSKWVPGDGGAADAVTSPLLRRVIATTEPDYQGEEGDLILVYAPPFSALDEFADGLGRWTKRWATWDWQVADDATARDGKIVKVDGVAGGAKRGLSFNPLDGKDTSQIEMLARVKVAANGSGFSGALVTRASGETGAENGYLATFYNSRFAIVKYINGALTVMQYVAPVGVPVNTWHWVRFRIDGANLKAKLWADGTAEPAAWGGEVTDYAHTSGGWTGLFASHNLLHAWDVVAVALEGATAVVP